MTLIVVVGRLTYIVSVEIPGVHVFDALRNGRRGRVAAVIAMVWLALSGCGESHGGGDGAVAMDAGLRDAGTGGTDAAGAADAGPPMDEPCETPGAVEMMACGRCGSLTRFCTSDRLWSYGPCEGELPDACTPGETGEQSCGNCGDAQAVCTETCEWHVLGACMDEGLCAPGERRRTADGCPAGQTREVTCDDACAETTTDPCRADACTMPGAVEDVACGMCGTQERFCGADGVWAYGTCDGEHGCMPGTTGDEPCGMCGTRATRCTTTCAWEPTGMCTGEGVCAPGTMERTGDGCPAGQTRLVSCDATCAYVEVEGCISIPPMDVILLFDMTGSHGTSVNATDVKSQVVAPLVALADVAVGVAQYADFPSGGYGAPSDRPFQGLQPPSLTLTTAQSGIDRLTTMMGADQPESEVEALATLAGLPPHPLSTPFACPSGTTAGGCWRAGAIRVVVVFTDAATHNGPQTSGTALYQPYSGITPAPAEWPDVRDAFRAQGIELFVVLEDYSGVQLQQHERMLDDLMLARSTFLIDRSRASWSMIGSTLTTRIAALR